MFSRMTYPGNTSYYEYSGNEVTAPISPTNYPGIIGSGLYESDEFHMYNFKIKKCPRARSHDWTLCPFAHRGEKAKRRDPSRYNYEPVPCPDYRDGQGICVRGHDCPYAHGVFEYWLHPAKYHTRACNLRPVCDRKVCFFAHAPEELRDETEAKRLHMLRLKINIPDSPNSSTSHDVVPGTTIVATNSYFSDEGTNDFLANLSGLAISDKDEGSSRFFGNFKTRDVVPKTTMVATKSKVINEGTNNFVASSRGVTISDKDEGSSRFYGRFKRHDVAPKRTNNNDGNEGTIDFLASLSGLTISGEDGACNDFYGTCNIDWIAELIK